MTLERSPRDVIGAPSVYPPLTLTAGREDIGPAFAVPVGVARRYNSAVVCRDGTWMAPSDVHVQTTGALEGEEMAQAPGGLLCRLLPGCQQWRRS